MGRVYCAKNLLTGKVYVGCTIRKLSLRISEHFSKALLASKSFTKSGKPKRLTKFQRAIINSNKSDWEWSILQDNIPKSDLRAYEIYWMVVLDSKNNGLNSTWGIGRY